MRLPLALVGWDTEQQTIKLPLFKKFRERADMPFCNFRAALQVHISPLDLSGCIYLPSVVSSSTSLPLSRCTAGIHGIWCTRSPSVCLEREFVACRRMQGAGSGHGCTAQSRMWTWTWGTLAGLSIEYDSESGSQSTIYCHVLWCHHTIRTRCMQLCTPVSRDHSQLGFSPDSRSRPQIVHDCRFAQVGGCGGCCGRLRYWQWQDPSSVCCCCGWWSA